MGRYEKGPSFELHGRKYLSILPHTVIWGRTGGFPVDSNTGMGFIDGGKYSVIGHGPVNQRGYLYTPGEILPGLERSIKSSWLLKARLWCHEMVNEDITISILNVVCKAGYWFLWGRKYYGDIGTVRRRVITSLWPMMITKTMKVVGLYAPRTTEDKEISTWHYDSMYGEQGNYRSVQVMDGIYYI